MDEDTWIIVGVVVGGLVVVIIILIVILLCIRHKRRKRSADDDDDDGVGDDYDDGYHDYCCYDGNLVSGKDVSGEIGYDDSASDGIVLKSGSDVGVEFTNVITGVRGISDYDDSSSDGIVLKIMPPSVSARRYESSDNDDDDDDDDDVYDDALENVVLSSSLRHRDGASVDIASRHEASINIMRRVTTNIETELQKRLALLSQGKVSSLTDILKRHVAVALQNSRRSYITSFNKGHKTFYGTRVYGDGTVLQAPDSDMRLHIPKDVEAFVYGHAHTGIQHLLSHIPANECLVAPIAEYYCVHKNENQDQSKHKFKIIIPHCMKNRFDISSIRVRQGDIYNNRSFQEISWFEVGDSYITIYTNGFSQFICTSCQRICHGQGKAFVFSNLIKYPTLQPLSSVRLYMCSPLYNIKDYRKDIVDVEQRYKRSLVEEEDLKWNPEQISSAQYLLISVQAQNEDCSPRQPIPQGLEWNQQSKTIKQKNSIQDMHDMFFCHLCKAEPSIVATFHFEHRIDDPSNLVMFSGDLGMRTDSNDVILQTFFAVISTDVLTKELNRQQLILAEITRELILLEEDLVGFGLNFGFTHGTIQQTRTNHPRSIEGAALHLACLWWEDGMATREEKVPTLLEAVRAIGKIRLVGWVEEKLKRGLEGASVNVLEGTHQPEGTNVNVSGEIDRVEGAIVNVAGSLEEIEGAPVNVPNGIGEGEGAPVNAINGIGEGEGAPVNVMNGTEEVEGAPVNVMNGIEEVEGAPVNVMNGTEEVEGAPVNVMNGIGEVEGVPVNVTNGIEQVEGAPVNAMNGIGEVEGAPVNVATKREQEEGIAVNVEGGIYHIEGTNINVEGGIDLEEIETPIVMVVDETEGRNQTIVKERYVGKVYSTYL